MELLLPSFPISSSSLPKISSEPTQSQQKPEVPKIEPILTLTSKIQRFSNSDPDDYKRDKEGTVSFFVEGPLLEYKIKKKVYKDNLKKSKIKFSETHIDIVSEKKTLRIWSPVNMIYEIIVAYHIIKKSKQPIILRKGDGNKLEENDTFSGRYIQWVQNKSNQLELENDFISFSDENEDLFLTAPSLN